MKVHCPVCKKEENWENNPFRPFCSDRCKLIDLGEWAMGKRSIPGDHDPTAEEDSARAPKPSKPEGSEE